MKSKVLSVIFILVLLLTGCSRPTAPVQIAATTQPVYEFTAALCEGTGLTVQKLITESVSCLHDYTLKVDQVRTAKSAETVILSGAGLEEFMEDILNESVCIDSSTGITLLCHEEDHEEHDHDHVHEHGEDPHIWLSPANAMIMAQNICSGLSARYPQYAEQFRQNLETLTARLIDLQNYGRENLSSLRCRELITFHDGFAYFAEAYDLDILESIEEESGSEASAQELRRLITMTRDHHLPVVFVEKNGSPSAASVICAETGADVYALDMAMSETGYFEAMYHNIDTIKEALG